MNNILLKLAVDLQALDAVIQPYKWSNRSKNNIQDLFKSMNDIITEGEHYCDSMMLDKKNHGDAFIPTKLAFPVPDSKHPNMGMWQGCAAYYIDKLTKAYKEDDIKSRDEAIYSLLDIAKAFDRELDPDTSPYDMLTNEDLRSDSAKCDYWRKLKYPDDKTPDPEPTVWTFTEDDPECVRKFIRENEPDNPFESSYMKSLKGKKFVQAYDISQNGIIPFGALGKGFNGYRGTLLQFKFDNGIPSDKTYTVHTELCLYFNDNDSLVTLNSDGEETAWSLAGVKDIMLEIGQLGQVWYYKIN